MKRTPVSTVLFGAVTAFSLALAPSALAQMNLNAEGNLTRGALVGDTNLDKPLVMPQVVISPAVTAEPARLIAATAVTSACGKLFDIDANADGLTAEERARIIQKNIDHALVKATNRTPAAVTIEIVNNNPVVKLDGQHIATADGNSAQRNRTSQMHLAEQWADAIKKCLADGPAVDRYLSMITGQFAALGARTESVAYIPAGKFLPVRLNCPINGATARPGQPIEAVLATDIPLQTDYYATRYDAYLPAGTIAKGHFTDSGNSYLGRGALGLQFHSLKTPNGDVIPINGHIMGGPGSWLVLDSEPDVTQCAGFARTLQDKGVSAITMNGQVCGGWRGYPIGAFPGVPFPKFTISRKAPVIVDVGEPMILQLAAPTAIAVCTNCAPTQL